MSTSPSEMREHFLHWQLLLAADSSEPRSLHPGPAPSCPGPATAAARSVSPARSQLRLRRKKEKLKKVLLVVLLIRREEAGLPRQRLSRGQRRVAGLGDCGARAGRGEPGDAPLQGDCLPTIASILSLVQLLIFLHLSQPLQQLHWFFPIHQVSF